jgi:hypothetical protein
VSSSLVIYPLSREAPAGEDDEGIFVLVPLPLLDRVVDMSPMMGGQVLTEPPFFDLELKLRFPASWQC